MQEHKGAIRWHEPTSQVWGHADESGHGGLLREAWQHNPNLATDLWNSIQRAEPCDTDLPTEGDQPGAIQLKEEEDEEDDRTPHDQRPTSTVAGGPQGGIRRMANLQGTMEAEYRRFHQQRIIE